MPQKRTEEDIQELLRRYRWRGDMTGRAFCEAEGIAPSVLGYYLRGCARPAVRLARVKITKEATARSGVFALVLANGRRIECGPAELPHLISAAERG
jgi:hypothetical protein